MSVKMSSCNTDIYDEIDKTLTLARFHIEGHNHCNHPSSLWNCGMQPSTKELLKQNLKV